MTCLQRTPIVIDGQREGEVTIPEEGLRYLLERSGFTSRLRIPISKAKVDRTVQLLKAENWAELHLLDCEMLSCSAWTATGFIGRSPGWAEKERL